MDARSLSDTSKASINERKEEVRVGRLDYEPLFGKMSPHLSPGEDQKPHPGDGGNRAYVSGCTFASQAKALQLCPPLQFGSLTYNAFLLLPIKVRCDRVFFM